MDYVERIFTNQSQIFADATGPRFNIPPGTRPLALHGLAEGTEGMARLPWDYKRPDSKHFMSNAKLETILKNGWPWRFLIGTGRILGPADGWYERPELADGTKQPHYIHGDGPLYFAALTAWSPGAPLAAAHGLAIVTNDTKGGMVDIHARRPVELPPEIAQRLADPAISAADARDLLHEGVPEDAFTWHSVRQEVGTRTAGRAGQTMGPR
ncbi:SOS response-associated peptidase family protein [Achromobacter sp.]|uniref:SOS response-associated peptidase family protein n=1 Tax=Achromobacter sp. TaxID=134375 RepID=UPI0028AAC7D5|nr:SOS response-associated peptidase family protein [Achromobacter sp.]